jgi:hydrogenase expression/formation protein HypD
MCLAIPARPEAEGYGRIDDGLTMVEQEGAVFTAFGDMMRMPGTRGSPLEHKARGADILQSILVVLRQLGDGEAKVENQYTRVVPWEGNRAALKAMAEVFELCRDIEWRGMELIPESALRIRDAYAGWDAERRFTVPGVRAADPKAAQYGEVLTGVLKPAQCKLFGTECTPERPVGALMVLSEGSCAGYHNYEHRKSLVDIAAPA